MKPQARYTILQEYSTLIVRSEVPGRRFERLFLAVTSAAAFWVIAREIFESHWWPLAGATIGIAVYFLMPGVLRAQLRMNVAECHTQTNFLKTLSQGRTLMTGDILWLEYREEGSAGDKRPGTGGLYAAKEFGSVCLLPLLNPEQTMKVIAAIEKKFPGLAETWQKQAPREQAAPQEVPPE